MIQQNSEFDTFCVVKSKPQEKVMQSVIGKCASEWYRLGINLGYSDSELRAMTFDIPTAEGKLQAVIERKSMKDGTDKVVEALLDVCDQIMPLAIVAVMKDLGIQYTGTGNALVFVGIFYYTVWCVCTVVSDRLLYQVGKDIGREWKRVAKELGLTSQDIDNVKMQAKGSRKRAWKMLQLWYAKMRAFLSVDEIHRSLQQLRKRQQTKKQAKSKLLFIFG